MSVQFFIFFLFLSLTNAWAFDPSIVSQIVYVESPTDTDNDGKLDLIYASIDRPVINQKLSTIYCLFSLKKKSE